MKEVDDMKTTAQIMRELREDHDLSQTQVAAVLGISQQHYSKYEKNDYQLPLPTTLTAEDREAIRQLQLEYEEATADAASEEAPSTENDV